MAWWRNFFLNLHLTPCFRFQPFFQGSQSPFAFSQLRARVLQYAFPGLSSSLVRCLFVSPADLFSLKMRNIYKAIYKYCPHSSNALWPALKCCDFPALLDLPSSADSPHCNELFVLTRSSFVDFLVI